MLLRLFLNDLWFELLLFVLAWLALPVALFGFKKHLGSLVISVLWAIALAVIAYLAFDYSARPRHPNLSAPLIGSFIALMAALGSLVSVSIAAMSAIGWRSSKHGLPLNSQLGTD